MKTQSVPPGKLENAIEEAFAYFHSDGGQYSAGERLKRFEVARQTMATCPEMAVSLLASEFDTINFQRKAAAYRFIIDLGGQALEAVKKSIAHCDRIGRIWLISILHYHGDNSCTSLMADLTRDKEAYAGQLASLALVFQGRQHAMDHDGMIQILGRALTSERRIEESAFFVADSALSCLRLLTGETFVETRTAVHFYNFDHFIFSPPVHPFPYTADRINTLHPRQRRQLADRVLSWWNNNRQTARLRQLVGCFEQ